MKPPPDSMTKKNCTETFAYKLTMWCNFIKHSKKGDSVSPEGWRIAGYDKKVQSILFWDISDGTHM